MGEQRKYKGYVVAAVIAGVLASCTGSHSGAGSGTGSGSGTASGPGSRSDDGSHAPLSVGRVKEMAADPGETCPVPFDMAAAAKSARIGERIRAGTVSGETADKSDPSAPLTLFKGALVSCGYGIGKEKAHVFTVGVGKGTAVGVLLPQVQHDAGMAMTELKAYAAEASKAPAGKPVLTPSGNVASVRLSADGKGDLALVVSLGEDRTALTKTQVTDLTGKLADQAHG
ncbi:MULTISPECIES: hypothetical protein [unclassified Streptomyces]|uniref:hypothetical protein n=1 Tax=unclassified Streptomyces TaxID=2593676 RepID=UPI002DDB3F55|nr:MULTISPECIES: hypothetical protein [unclassified Streptomyces]WSA95128.1 hypothetical protein OIE63_28915 [Streptomyces sp. NBC_01795]WSB79549.1 hypothetical protein OHB04_30030 [Streptomyces sp. NBC_01775]WSS40960.1 hypothetical protein OG220_10340 [Streptomyces sp. NBC_01187]